jgi:hypothetical protein
LIGTVGKQTWLSVDVEIVPVPVVTSVTPDPVLQGGQLTITGTFLDNVVSVYIGNVSQTIVSNSSVEIVVDVSPTQPHAPGQVVEVTTPFGADNSQTVEVLAPPLLTTVSPNPVPPGQVLVINGMYLENASSVTIGATAATIQANTSTQIDVMVSAAQPQGPGQTVTVTTPGGTDTIVVDITPPPTVTSVSPSPVAPGATLTINGTDLDNASSVTIGGTAATIATNSSTVITVTVAPGQTPGPVQTVSVTTPGGTDATATVDILPPPSVTGVAPNPVRPGNALTITGTSLDNAGSVTIGGTVAIIQSNTGTQIIVTVSAGQPVGIDLVVSVTTPGGTDSSATVTVEAPPVSSGGSKSGSSGGCDTTTSQASSVVALLVVLAMLGARLARRRQRGN